MKIFFKNWFRTKKFWLRFVSVFILTPIFFFLLMVFVLYIRQDNIVKEIVNDMNQDFHGAFEIRDSHVSLFENFPYVSIDIEGFKVHETKKRKSPAVLDLDHLYAGVDVFTILFSNVQIKKIKAQNGQVNLIQHKDGTLNIANAFKPVNQQKKTEDYHLNIQKIKNLL